jgi:hypothetical protein
MQTISERNLSMADANELTVELEEEGRVVVEELDKRILTKGAWTTIMFKYRDWNQKKNDYGPAKYSIRRYQKLGDLYRQRAKFNISSDDQARQIIQVLQEWLAQTANSAAVAATEDAGE